MQLIARALATVVALALSASLAACGGEDDDASAPISPGAPSVSGSASPSGATAGDELTVAPPGETAEQFIRRWFALVNHAQRTGDVEGMLKVSGPDCDSCRGFAREMKSIYAAGGEVRGGDDEVISLKAESKTQWVVQLRAAPSEFERRRGATTESFPGGPHRSRMYLVDLDGRWIVGATESLT